MNLTKEDNMKRSCHVMLGMLLLVLAGLLLADSAFSAKANAPVMLLNVTALKQEGVSQCDQGTWSYKLSWKPALQGGTPWLKYIVTTQNCPGHTYECTAQSCTAQVSGCSKTMAVTAAIVAADYGKKLGTKVGGIARPPNCQ
jgi:hypothetical protein